MSLTVFMVPPATLMILASVWLTGVAIIVGLFVLNHRRLQRSGRSE